jgi:uncharacterized RDD family membrane protein YckC
MKAAPLSAEYRDLHVRPWMRFFARLIDLYVFAFFFTLIMMRIYPAFSYYHSSIVGLISLFCWFLIEPFFIAKLGTTLGKFLLNIQVRDLDGNKLSLSQAFHRSFWVLCVGFGFGIPIVTLVTFAYSYITLNKTGNTYWDKNTFTVTHGEISYVKGTIAALLFLLSVGLMIASIVIEYQQRKALESPAYYIAQVEEQNQNMPQMIDSETELLRLSFENNTLGYHYRLVNKEENQINSQAFEIEMRKQILDNACDRLTPNEILMHGYSLSFDYSDKKDKHIATILITPEDCK